MAIDGTQYPLNLTTLAFQEFSFQYSSNEDIRIMISMEYSVDAFNFQMLNHAFSDFNFNISESSLVYIPHDDPNIFEGIYQFRISRLQNITSSAEVSVLVGNVPWSLEAPFDWIAFAIFISVFSVILISSAILLKFLSQRRGTGDGAGNTHLAAGKPKIFTAQLTANCLPLASSATIGSKNGAYICYLPSKKDHIFAC